MTSEQFRAWRLKHFRSQSEAAKELGISRQSLFDYEQGFRRGTLIPVSIPRPIELACLAINAGLHKVPFKNRDVIIL